MSSCGCGNSSTLTNGIDGYNAFTITTASYTQPAVNTNVTISVSNTGQYTGRWAITGQTIFVEDGGYYKVVSSTNTTITMKYESDYETYNQSLTAAAGTVATNKKVSPAGKKGIDGTDGVTILYAYNDLTGTGNDAATGESTLGSYTVLANEMDTNGDQLDIDVYYTYSENDEVTINLKLGGNTIFTFIEQVSIDTKNNLNIRISRISNTSQQWVITKQSSNATKLYYSGFVDQTSSSATLSNSNVFAITADNTIFGANQVVLNQLVIKKLNA
jgi:hypothetical protein